MPFDQKNDYEVMRHHVETPPAAPRRHTRDIPEAVEFAVLKALSKDPDDRFATWASAVGVECGPLAADEKEDMIHELDAVVAHLYGLSEPQLVHIFETFHVGWDYGDRLNGVLRHYHAWTGRS